MSKYIIYHGSEYIIPKPDISKGKPYNDYGRGFYCTRQKEMAKEWACKGNKDGFANRYEIDMTELNVLNLMDGNYSVLNWIALLLKNRSFMPGGEIGIAAKEYILSNFLPDAAKYDVIIGYRADDSYFSYAEAFIENSLPLRSLTKALKLGKLGEQIVLVSEKAFLHINYLDAEIANKSVYYNKFISRDSKAREDYKNEVKKDKLFMDDIFVLDILRGEMKGDDPRIQPIVLK